MWVRAPPLEFQCCLELWRLSCCVCQQTHRSQAAFCEALADPHLLPALLRDGRRFHERLFACTDMSFITTWRVTFDDNSLQLPLHGDRKCCIDWGDGGGIERVTSYARCSLCGVIVVTCLDVRVASFRNGSRVFCVVVSDVVSSGV